MSTGDSSSEKGEATVTTTRRVALSVIPITPFGKYNLIGKLGHGGMAEVFLAYTVGPAGFRKLVVIKRLHQHLEEEPGFLDMFLDEARLAARLNHANVVQTYEVGAVDGSHFIAMEYLEGQGLDRVRRRCVTAGERIPPPIVARIIVDALEGLHYAHELKDFDGKDLGVVHRDVSPQNVFVTYEGMVKLLDFGIAKAATHVVETRTGVVKGKFAYIAPEQARGRDIDRRADLWSMGVVLWEALAGKRLFKGPNDLATLSETLMGKIPDLGDVEPSSPDALVTVTRKALTRNRDQRYQTALEMRGDLEEYLSSVGKEGTRSAVSVFVKDLFGDVIDQHRKVLEVCLSDASMEQIRSAQHAMAGAAASGMTPDGVSALTSPTPTSGISGQFGPGSHSGPISSGVRVAEGSAQSVVIREPASKLGRNVAIVVAILALVVAGAVILWQTTRGPESTGAGTSQPTAPVEPPLAPRTLVTFTSDPPRAEVLLGGRILGRTPLEREMDQSERGQTYAFVFRLDGYLPLTIERSLRGDSSEIHAELHASAPPPPAPAEVDAGPHPSEEVAGPPTRPRWPRGPRWRPPAGGEEPGHDPGGAPPPPPTTGPGPGEEPPERPGRPVVVDGPSRPVIVDDQAGGGVPVVD